MCFQITTGPKHQHLAMYAKGEGATDGKAASTPRWSTFFVFDAVDVSPLADTQGWLWNEISVVRAFLWKDLYQHIYDPNIVNVNSLL